MDPQKIKVPPSQQDVQMFFVSHFSHFFHMFEMHVFHI
jgi:hypothetical protein